MCKCKKCEMLNRVPIFVVDYESNSPFVNDLGHWEEGFVCILNGKEAKTMEMLFAKSECPKIIG